MARYNYFLRLEEIASRDRVVLIADGAVLTRDEELYWRRDELAALNLQAEELHLLESGETCYFALRVDESAVQTLGVSAQPLRSLVFDRGEEVLGLAGKAHQILDWYRHHRYCGLCGSATEPHREERAVFCARCDKHFYPRINPCVIVLVTRGREVLLASNRRYQGQFYSCLAGFIEVGETAEQTLHREVREEVNIEVDNLRYLTSQSWPFPSQLMLGFLADYAGGELQPDGVEITDAVWFDVEALPEHPGAEISVAGQLIEHWRSHCRQS